MVHLKSVAKVNVADGVGMITFKYGTRRDKKMKVKHGILMDVFRVDDRTNAYNLAKKRLLKELIMSGKATPAVLDCSKEDQESPTVRKTADHIVSHVGVKGNKISTYKGRNNVRDFVCIVDDTVT